MCTAVNLLLNQFLVRSVRYRNINSLTSKVTMSQKSLLSFFQRKPVHTSVDDKANSKSENKKDSNQNLETASSAAKKRKREEKSDNEDENAATPSLDVKSTTSKKQSVSKSPVTPCTDKTSQAKTNGNVTPEETKGNVSLVKTSGNVTPEEMNGDVSLEKKRENINEIETEKPLKTLSFLGSKNKRASKTPKKPAAKSVTKENSKVSETKKGTPKVKKIKVAEEENTSIKSEEETSENEPETSGEINEEETPVKKKSSSPRLDNKETKNPFLNSSSAETPGISYNPSKEKYDPIKDACWKYGESVPYLALAKTLQKIEETSARLKIIDILSNYFRSVIALSNKDLIFSVYLCLNKLGPEYDGQELGIADMYLMKAIAQCTGRSMAQIKADAAESGDLGIVAEKSRSNQRVMFRPKPLIIKSVFNQLNDIASISGNSAIGKKIDKIQALFVSCRDCEARFIIRSLAGKLRIGLAEQSVIQALALACTMTPPNQEYPPEVLNASKKVSSEEFKKRADEELLILKTTYSECPNFNEIIPVLLEKGVRALPEFCKITPGIPVKPMLAKPTKGVQEVLQRFEGLKFTCEYKYDGERAQIHIVEDGSVKIFSRNLEDNTSKYPDIINDIRSAMKSEVKSCILDAEAVAWDREQKKIMPFQVLSTRKRKGANIDDIKVQVCVYLFDLLYFNGESLVQQPFLKRRELLQENFHEVEEKFSFAKNMDTNTMEEVQEFLDESVKGNCEGLMVKTLDVEATYEIAKRSHNWLKLKKDYLDGCGDTLDLVVIGGYIGKGKRTGQYGGYLLASYDSDNDEYQTICKIGTGFTDEALIKHAEFLKQHIIAKPKPYYRFDPSHEPDLWFDAVQVWEVKCADLSLSPIYYSGIGLVDPEKGISLRFPRFLRIRDDKTVEQATSSRQVAELYQNQDQIKNQTNAKNKINEEDF